MSIRLPSGPGALTERNREVLRLLERGLTNYEIATELGISLEGAKYHVREIMTRLNVESREEAVAAWRREQQPARRMRRALFAMFAGKGGWATAAVVAAGLGALAVVLALALGGDETPPASPPEPDATATSTVRPAVVDPTATATSSPTLAASAATVTPAVPVGTPIVTVTGLFEGEPPDGSPSPIVRQLGVRPVSPFEPWDGEQLLIYDTLTGGTIDLGTSVAMGFSPDSEWFAWLDSAEASRSGIATLTNLLTGERRTFGLATSMEFLEGERFVVNPEDRSGVTVYDLATGLKSSNQELTKPRNSPVRLSNDDRSRYESRQGEPDPATRLPRGGYGRTPVHLLERETGRRVLEFEALTFAFGAPGELVVAAPAEGIESDVQNLKTNIFIVDIATGQAEFIARARYGQGPNWPLTATADYVLWTDGFCSPQQGRMQLFDRRTGALTEIDDGIAGTDWGDEAQRFGRLTPGGDIVIGSINGDALVDPETLEYIAVLPGRTLVPSMTEYWSADFRFATYVPGGRGGLC